MLPGDIDAISEAHIRALVDAGAEEKRLLEFKGDLNINEPAERREFLADVSSFANTSGGDLLFGIENAAVSGPPAYRVSGIQLANADATVAQLENILRDGLSPRLPTLAIRSVPLEAGLFVLVIRVGPSWQRPHRVTYRASGHFYGRNSNGKYQLDVSELRTAFLGTEGIAQKISEVRLTRLLDIRSGDTPVRLKGPAQFVVHIIPFSAVASERHIDLATIEDRRHELVPRLGGSYSFEYTLEGMLVYEGSRSSSSEWYVHVHRTGMVEVVNCHPIDMNEKTIAPTDTARELIRIMEVYPRFLVDTGISLPVIFMLSFVGIRGCRVYVDHGHGYRAPVPLARDELILPSVIVDELGQSPAKLARLPIDALWNACGFQSGPKYDDSGAIRPS